MLTTTPPAAPGVTERKVGETLVPLKGRLKEAARRGRLREPPIPVPCRPSSRRETAGFVVGWK